ncbi:MAG: helix-turn-helix domain-containing protein [Opitutaceae bacterium]|nr:helix-turn-helix domain-containing protein [Opitutaceae bacterium]
MDSLSETLAALSHPTRRAILSSLAKDGPQRFLDVAKPFDTALNAVTKHLKQLERAGLIHKRKQGREVVISFRAGPIRDVVTWANGYEQFWNTQLDAFQRHFHPKQKS